MKKINARTIEIVFAICTMLSSGAMMLLIAIYMLPYRHDDYMVWAIFVISTLSFVLFARISYSYLIKK